MTAKEIYPCYFCPWEACSDICSNQEWVAINFENVFRAQGLSPEQVIEFFQKSPETANRFLSQKAKEKEVVRSKKCHILQKSQDSQV